EARPESRTADGALDSFTPFGGTAGWVGSPLWHFKAVELVHRVLHLVSRSNQIPRFGVVVLNSESTQSQSIVSHIGVWPWNRDWRSIRKPCDWFMPFQCRKLPLYIKRSRCREDECNHAVRWHEFDAIR